MPRVGGKHYPYTKKGKAAAARARAAGKKNPSASNTRHMKGGKKK